MGMPGLFLCAAIGLNSASSVVIKYSGSLRGLGAGLLMGLGLGLGALNVLCYSRALESLKLSEAYLALSAGSLLVITLASAVLFRELPSLRQLGGMALVLGGIGLVVT